MYAFLSFERYGQSFYGIMCKYFEQFLHKSTSNNTIVHILNNNWDTIDKYYL